MFPLFIEACLAVDRGPGKLQELRRIQYGHRKVVTMPTAQSVGFHPYESAFGVVYDLEACPEAANEHVKPPRTPTSNPFLRKKHDDQSPV